MYHISIEASSNSGDATGSIRVTVHGEKIRTTGCRNIADLTRDQIPPNVLARLIDRLTSRLGKKRVLRPHLSAEAQPEFSFEMHAVVELDMQRWCNHVLRPARNSSEASGGHPFRLATRSEGPAQQSTLRLGIGAAIVNGFAAVMALELHRWKSNVTAKSRTGAPVRLFHSGNWQQVIRFWGPERIETGWWRSRAVRREYFRVEIDSWSTILGVQAITNLAVVFARKF